MTISTDDELAQLISIGEIGAITLDTSVFDQLADNLRHKLLVSLGQFNGTSISVLFSDIVVSEVKAHISRKAAGTIAAVLKELKEHRRVWDHKDTVEELGANAHLTRDPSEFADREWQAFTSAVESETLKARNLVDIDALTERYFSNAPPFAEAIRKKAEFPDAIALLSLEAWAKAHASKVIAISTDGGWAAFAAESQHLICLPSIPAVLDHFNREARFVAERAMAYLQVNDSSDIPNAVETFFDDMSVEIEADANPYGFEATSQGGALQYWELAGSPLIIESDEDEITFVVVLSCKILFEASFQWFAYGGGDWHSLGQSTEETVEKDCDLQFSITCSRKIDTEPEVYDVSVTSRPLTTIDFGHIDPALDYEG